MQIGEDHLSTSQFLSLGGKRLLHFHDQFGALEDLIGGCDKPGSDGRVFIVADARALSCMRLNIDAMASRDQFGDSRRA